GEWCRAGDALQVGYPEMEPNIAGIRRDARDSLRDEGNAAGHDVLPRAQRHARHVVIAGAVADALPAAVEGQEWHDENVGSDFGSLRRRLADAPNPRNERFAKGGGAHGARLHAPGDRPHCPARAAIFKLALPPAGIDP